jgi:hypothetical protein
MKRILIAILMVLILSNIAYAAKPNIGADQLRLDSGLVDTDGSLKVYTKAEVDSMVGGGSVSGGGNLATLIAGTEQTVEVTYRDVMTAGTFAGVYNEAGTLKATNIGTGTGELFLNSTLFTDYAVDTTITNMYDLGILVIGNTVFTFIRNAGGISYKAYSYANNTLTLQTELTELFTNAGAGICAIRQLDTSNIFISYISTHTGSYKTYYRTASFSGYIISSPSSENLIANNGRDVAAELFGNDLVVFYDKGSSPYYQILTWGGISFAPKVSETSIVNHPQFAVKLDSVKIDGSDIFLFTTNNNNIVSYLVYNYNGSDIVLVTDTTTLSSAVGNVFQITSSLLDSKHIFVAYTRINDAKYQILKYDNDTVSITVNETQILNNNYNAIASSIIDTNDLLFMFNVNDTYVTSINGYSSVLGVSQYLYPCYIKTSGNANTTAEVQLTGNITTSGLSTNSKYYLNNTFTLTSTKSDCGLFLENSTTGECNIGLATSSTNLLMIPSFK